MYRLVRPILFLFSAEQAHHLGLFITRLFGPLSRLLRTLILPRSQRLSQQLLGGLWRHPIGLAAGLDKDGRAAKGLAAFGFAAIEIGTITAHAQPGNPKPRLFRIKGDRAIVNRFGFNNPGCQTAQATLARHRLPCPLGGNIGKSKITPNDEAAADYQASVAALGPHVDYLVINVSSPNTPGLRDLQQLSALEPLIQAVQHAIGELDLKRHLPLALKVAPDLADEDLDAIADLAVRSGLDALIATNTTISREGLSIDDKAIRALGAGGLSGAPLCIRARAVTAHLARRLDGRVPLISVGGIDSAEEVYRRIRLGACAVQIYSALIYQGPLLPSRMARQLDRLLQRDGFSHIGEAIGVDL
jgi:dihydroorotate dehydrogenase